eukprot:37436-Chlamydomonas_euryale.AAC.1
MVGAARLARAAVSAPDDARQHGAPPAPAHGDSNWVASWAAWPLHARGARGSGNRSGVAFCGGGWPGVEVAALETLRVAAEQVGDAADAWHSAAASLRHHHRGLSEVRRAA